MTLTDPRESLVASSSACGFGWVSSAVWKEATSGDDIGSHRAIVDVQSWSGVKDDEQWRMVELVSLDDWVGQSL